MKRIQSKKITESGTLYMAILINVIVVYFFTEKDFSVPTLLIILILLNLFLFFKLYSESHLFEYNDERLIVTNQLNPFLIEDYKIKHLKEVQIKYHNGQGFYVEVYRVNGMSSFGAGLIEKSNLEIMVKDINDYIRKTSNA